MIWTAERILHVKCRCGSDLSVEVVGGQPCVYCTADKTHLHEPIPMHVALEVDELIGFMDIECGLYEERMMENDYEMGFGPD